MARSSKWSEHCSAILCVQFNFRFKNKDKYEFVNKIECSKDSAQFLVYPEGDL